MRVVIAGGTGFVGQALVTALSERGDDVTVLSRAGASSRCRLGPRSWCHRGSGAVKLVHWTPDHTGSAGDEWVRAVSGADAVVQLSGAGVLDQRWTPSRKQELRASRIRSTEVLARTIAAAEAKPRVFVSGSAVGFYGTETRDRVLTEADPAGSDFLAQLVVDWEGAAEPARAAGVRVVHPRLGIVLGNGGGVLQAMLRPFRMFVGGPVGDGKQYVPWIHIEDAARAIVHAIDHDGLRGPCNVSAPEPVTMNELADLLGHAIGRPSALRVPAIAIKVAFGEGATAVLTGQRAVPKRLVENGFDFVFPELESALADLATPRGHARAANS